MPPPAFQTRRDASREPGDDPGPSLDPDRWAPVPLALVSPVSILLHEDPGPGGSQAPFQLSTVYSLSSPTCLRAASFS